MDDDAPVLAALGVLLTQLRTARRALEDVQRNTARYAGFDFASAFAEGPRFGQPPLFEGALMVHVVNINDLAPGNGFGGFIEALFGGIGNFFSNLVGGLISGTLSGFALPDMIGQLERIVAAAERIIPQLGLGEHKPEPGKESKSAPEAQARSGESLLTTLEGVRGVVREVTALLQAGAGDRAGAEAAAGTSDTPKTETGERWMAILNGVNILLDRASRLVDGLIILIPMAIGGISLLITSLGGIRKALLETIQFVLRNTLILRGVLLTVIFETVASAARLAGSIVAVLGTSIQTALGAIFGVIRTLLGAAFDAVSTLTNALQTVAGTLLKWLVEGVFNALRAIGDLAVFQTVDRLVRILPALLPAVYMLKSSKEMPPAVLEMLQKAQAASAAVGAAPAAGGKPAAPAKPEDIIGKFPDIKGILQPLSATLGSAVDATGNTVEEAVRKGIGQMSGALTGLAGQFDGAAKAEADFSRGVLDRHIGAITDQAERMTKAISTPIAAEGPATGLEKITTAYQDWLTKGGMAAVLNQVNGHFTKQAAAGGEPTGALRLLRGQYDRARASVEIDKIEIVLEPEAVDVTPLEPSPDFGPGDYPIRTDEDVYLAVRRHERELEDRGIRPTDPDMALG